MPVAERAGHTIHYEGIGDPSAPPLLLIMGMGLSSRAWESLPARLSERFRVLVFDNRGTGRSGRRGWMYRMRDLADDAVTVLDAVQVSQANVFGISMGGMIAQELAIRHPYRVRRLALGATFASWLRGDKPSLRTAFDLLLLILQRQRVPAERLGRLLVSREFHKANPTRALEWIARSGRAEVRCAAAQVAAILGHATLRRLEQIRAPTLVITGDADRLVPPRNSEVLAAGIPDARLRVLRGAGHVFPLEREEETVRALTEHFLAQ
ncbi:MAG TPA: alpha/beta fold hydrolase [Myxococcales bacterium]|jgi:3-oxoadipate enol-lactonase|nr:alpha/beta fold hydrolase [Myxococcales bacterium]